MLSLPCRFCDLPLVPRTRCKLAASAAEPSERQLQNVNGKKALREHDEFF